MKSTCYVCVELAISVANLSAFSSNPSFGPSTLRASPRRFGVGRFLGSFDLSGFTGCAPGSTGCENWAAFQCSCSSRVRGRDIFVFTSVPFVPFLWFLSFLSVLFAWSCSSDKTIGLRSVERDPGSFSFLEWIGSGLLQAWGIRESKDPPEQK